MAHLLNDVVRRARSGTADLAERVSSNRALDGIPLASQGKSLVQALSGNHEAAARTQDNFTKRCVGVSQLRSAVEHQRGDRAASSATRAEFDRGMEEADVAVKTAFSHIATVGEGIARSAEQVITPLAKQLEPVANRAGKTLEHAIDSAAAGAVSGAAAAGGVAQRLVESDWGRRFGELLHQHQHRQETSQASGSCGAVSRGSKSVPPDALDRYTILAAAKGSQCGTQCPCCLESLQEGESIRVLPCFHALHSGCAESWLSRQGRS
mmetsp:Transcript_153391/g.282644  ORF Transcript_153391/g.282644 Transcript_153391/m.282644 type:complete len:266 (+) Transcript_153391:41-838(+)